MNPYESNEVEREPMPESESFKNWCCFFNCLASCFLAFAAPALLSIFGIPVGREEVAYAVVVMGMLAGAGVYIGFTAGWGMCREHCQMKNREEQYDRP